MDRIWDMTQQPMFRRTLAAVLVLFVFTACQPKTSTASNAGTVADASPQGAAAVTKELRSRLPNFAALVQQQGPAVVNITTKGKKVKTRASSLSPDDPLFDFFRRFGMPNLPPSRESPEEGDAQRVPGGEASGFIVSADGYVLTNAHVVDAAAEVIVRMIDRREFTAKVIGIDKPTDVAVLKIDAKDLPVVNIGVPARLRPGEWVVAIGSPFGFENSVTAGIVSATARFLPGSDSNYVNFIKTDVAINPGNSGGPLFNLEGEVIGINSQIYSRSGGYMGISFAIPIDVAINVKDQILEKGKVSRGKIGVSIQEVNAQFAETFGLDRPRGALVSGVVTNGPAAKGGIRAGDIILSANGQKVERSADLPAIIGMLRPGAQATLELWRDRATISLKVRIAELETESSKKSVEDSSAPTGSADRLGLLVRELSSAERREMQTSGFIVIERAAGAAREAGIQTGDIVLGVNGRPVQSLKEFRAMVGRDQTTVALLVQREDAQIFVPIRVGGD